MTLRISMLWVYCLVSACLMAQNGAPSISVDPSYDAERLVREVFANDRCETIFNVRQIGNNPDGIGYFTGDEEVLGFNRGIVLSTGKVKDAEGPNSRTNTGSQLSGRTPDPDLDVVASGNVFDRSGMEFDFIPLESEITFRYVFASEEYCEFVGGAFNDIFGFFVSGPGFDGPYSRGGENIATVPNTRQVVSINSINYDNNRAFYLDNEHPTTKQEASCRGSTETGPRFQSIEYDGQTVTLTATLRVQPCETYHIRLLVADVRDSDFDSAVFLEAGSFDLGSSVSLESEEGGETPVVAYEGCKPGIIRVVRDPQSDINRDQTISYRVADNPVASDSLDFQGGNGTVTIPAGEQYAEIEITALADTLTEGDESAWIIYDVPCACFTDSVQIVIREADSLSLGLGDPFLYCPSEGTKLTADVAGGVPPYSYAWSFGSTEAEPEFRGNLPDSIGLVVTDACGAVRTGTAATLASDPPDITLPDRDLTACWGDSIALPTIRSGAAPFTVTYRQNGGPVETIELGDDPELDPWIVSRSGTYQVIGIQDRACASRVNELSELTLYQPVMNVDYTDPSCNGLADGSITIDHLKSIAPYRYFVDEREIGGPVTNDLAAGSYKLRVIDGAGCEDTTRLDLLDPEPIRPVAFTCQDLRRRPIALSASGGQAPYTYSPDGISFSGDFSDFQVGDTYQLTIRDAAGCELRQPDFYYPASGREFVRLQNFYPQDVGGAEEIRPTYFLPPQQIVSYSWSPAEIFDCPTCPNPVVSAPFSQSATLVIEDIFGCVDSVATSIAVDGTSPVFVPNVFSPDGDGTNDYMTVFANPDLVTEIVTFQVYTRWGELVFSESGFPPNSARRGWDGYLGSRLANVGSYLWTVQYRLYDGELVEAAGTTILMSR